MTEKSTTLSPQAVLGRQFCNLQKYGYQLPFYGKIGSEIPLPDKEKLKLVPALLVDYETPIDRQCQLLGIKNFMNLSYHKDLLLKPQGRWGWIYGVEDGTKMLGKSSNSSIQEFKGSNRLGLMTVEGLALVRENRDLLRDHYIDLSGSWYERGGQPGIVPNLCMVGFELALDCRFVWRNHPGWGSASCALV